MSTGAIVGIVVAVVGVLACGGYFYYSRKRSLNKGAPLASEDDQKSPFHDGDKYDTEL
jgi:hypothetical protein